MKIGRYRVESDEAEDGHHVDLAEINLWASPAELRRIAAFLTRAADTVDCMGATYDCEHLSDRQRGFDDSPHFVVIRAE